MSTKEIILKELKAAGLDIAEESTAAVVRGTLNAIEEIVKQTENKYDDMLLPVLEIVKPKLMKLIDTIDGEEDLVSK